ncbi:diguanylate cyclase [Eubacteriaceae bacterium ES3]|nr:diguanylate cyclase [Eubacteriaceae bacterium ES3]
MVETKNQVEKNENRLRQLVDVLRQSSASIQSFVDYTLKQAIELTESQMGYITCCDDLPEIFSLNSGWEDDLEDHVRKAYKEMFLGKHLQMLEKVRKICKPVVVNDFKLDSSLKKSQRIEIENMMVVPVLREEKIIGTIGLANRSGGFGEAEVLHMTLLMEAVFNVVTVRQARNELEQLSNRLKLATRVAKIGVFDWDMISDQLVFDEQMIKIFDLDIEAGQVDHSIWEQIIHPDDIDQVRREINSAIINIGECETEFRTLSKKKQIRILATVSADENGRPIRMIGANWDITKEKMDLNKLLESNFRLEEEIIERSYIEDALRVSEDKFKTIIDTSPDGIAITSMEGIVEFVTDRTVEMWGYDSQEEILGRNVMEFVHESYLEKAIYFISEMLRGHLTGAAEYLMIKKDGSHFYSEANANILRDKDGNPTGILYIERDVTERHQMEDEMKEMIHKDQLTGLYNRRKIDEVLIDNEHSMTESRLLSVIMVDIDFFKKVNDEHGHLIGDEVLIAVSRLLEEGIRHMDVLGRWGGEEFIIICPDTDLSGAHQLAEKLRLKIADYEFEAVGKKTCSFGVAQLKEGETVDDVLSRSDSALYLAKEMGRNRVITEEKFYTA